MTRLIPFLALALIACSKKAAAPTSGSNDSSGSNGSSTRSGSAAGAGSSEPTSNTGSDAPAGSAAGSGSGSATGSSISIAVVAGTSCDTHGKQITKAGDSVFKLAGTTLRGEHMHGCGCPTGTLFTLVYKAASPLEVRICFDQSKDSCEMACRDVSFDLAKPLADAKATGVKFVD